jgi:hypothetical protein
VHKGPERMNIPSGKCAVGYGRPPEHSKWKKGQCGNPARIRKRTAKPVVAMIDEFFASEHVVVENGIPKRRSAFEIILLQLHKCTRQPQPEVVLVHHRERREGAAFQKNGTGSKRPVTYVRYCPLPRRLHAPPPHCSASIRLRTTGRRSESAPEESRTVERTAKKQ